MSDLIGWLLLALRALMALLLYGFLVSAFFVLWKDLQAQGRTLADRRTPAVTINILGDHTPSQLAFYQPLVHIGRDPACECAIENETVSARHARLAYRQAQWWLEDLESKNGTFLNDQPVTTATVLTNKDRIRCGSITLEVTFSNSEK